MEYKNIDSQHLLVRLDPNEEIVTALMQIAEKEKIGRVNGIRGEVDINVFNGYKDEFRLFLEQNCIR